MTTARYAVATGLRGFGTSTLRVRVYDLRDGLAWVRTASLRDAGTPLVLDVSQITFERDVEASARHTDGLVTLDG